MKNEFTLKHVAIIPDGNRRWAKKKNFPVFRGHLGGAENFHRILDTARNLGIRYITIWGGSFDNLTKRRKLEIKGLLKVYDNYFKKLLDEDKIFKDKIRIRVLGLFEKILPKSTLAFIKKLEDLTKQYNNYNLTLLIGYNGTDEMIEAVKKAASGLNKKFTKITPRILRENLWSRELPDVDLIIRTGVEDDPHNSAGFMMWHTAYSRYYFTKTLWPDFSPPEFRKAVFSFLKTQRRLGK